MSEFLYRWKCLVENNFRVDRQLWEICGFLFNISGRERSLRVGGAKKKWLRDITLCASSTSRIIEMDYNVPRLALENRNQYRAQISGTLALYPIITMTAIVRKDSSGISAYKLYHSWFADIRRRMINELSALARGLHSARCGPRCLFSVLLFFSTIYNPTSANRNIVFHSLIIKYIIDIFMRPTKKRGINVWKIHTLLYFPGSNNAKLNITSE